MSNLYEIFTSCSYRNTNSKYLKNVAVDLIFFASRDVTLTL